MKCGMKLPGWTVDVLSQQWSTVDHEVDQSRMISASSHQLPRFCTMYIMPVMDKPQIILKSRIFPEKDLNNLANS